MFSAFQNFGRLGAGARAVAAAWSPTTLFAAGEAGGLWDFSTLANLYQDSAGTTPCTAVGDPIGLVLDTSGRGNNLSQSSSTKRPILGRMPATGVRNLLVGTATLPTQNVAVAAGSHTIQFTGEGSVTASGAYSGALTNGQTFTCTAGTLTLTVSGSVTNAQLEAGSTATAKQVVTTANDITEPGVADVYTAYFDGTDDCLVSPSMDFSATDKMSVFAGARKVSDVSVGIMVELSASFSNGSFFISAPAVNNDPSYGFASRGTNFVSIPAFGYAAGISNVLTGACDISAPLAKLRVNGTQASSSSGDQGTGNFGNYPLYVGQRGASSLPYKGFLSALCARGAATDATTVESMEQWLASKTPGVSL